MARTTRDRSWWIMGLLAVGAVVLLIAAIVALPKAQAEPEATPTRVVEQGSNEPSQTPSPLATPTPTPTPTELVVAGSAILEVQVPAVGLNVKVSGETYPRQTENCKGAEVCIDPPVSDQAAWYGVTPATPSTGTVRLFGHTSWNDPAYAAFNDILAMKENDEIIVITETGTFTYRAKAPDLVPYSQVAQSGLIWGNDPERLVLVTCNNAEESGTVVEAWLVSVTPR